MQPQVNSETIAEILVSLVDGQLQFTPLSGFGPGTTINHEGNMVIEFEEFEKSRALLFRQDSTDFAFSGFSAKRKGSPRSSNPIVRGKVPNPPFSVSVQDNTIFLEDLCEDKSSMGTFSYTLYFMTEEGPRTHDPEILNKGGIMPDYKDNLSQ
jgi:hypothetical protein